MKAEISIAIITKNRLKELELCLDSILKQSQKPNEVIVVDNDEHLSANKIASKKKYQKLRISYNYLRGSVPKCRNFALKIAKTKYLGFTDDDCILNKNWVKQGFSSINNSKSAYVLGKTLLLNPENIFALGQFIRDDYWKDYNSQIFDTKNVIIDSKLIKQKKLKFDENCQKEFYDSADFDFDFTLKQSKVKGIYCPQMTLQHKETTTFFRFTKRAYSRGFLAKYLDRKWKLDDKLVDLRTKNPIFWFLKMIRNFSSDFKEYNQKMNNFSRLPLYKKLLAFFVIKLFERYYVMGYVANQKI